MKNLIALPPEEKANVLTHGLGLLFIISATPLMVFKFLEGSGWIMLGGLSFCFGATFVFLSSTWYHYTLTESRKKVWRTIDHIAIYFLIGGTYTSFILKFHFDDAGLKFLTLHWFIIAVGIIFKVFFTGRYEFFSTVLYLVLGWMVVFIMKPLTQNMDAVVLGWLISGGIFYTLGVVFYLWEKLPYNHGIWHLMVIGGCASHFISIYNF